MRTLRTPKFQEGAQNKARNDSNEGASENPETPQELGRVQVEGPHKVHISRRCLLICWKMIFWQSFQGPGRGPIMCERFRWRIHKCPGNRKGVVHFDEDQDSCLGQRSALLTKPLTHTLNKTKTKRLLLRPALSIAAHVRKQTT